MRDDNKILVVVEFEYYTICPGYMTVVRPRMTCSNMWSGRRSAGSPCAILSLMLATNYFFPENWETNYFFSKNA